MWRVDWTFLRVTRKAKRAPRCAASCWARMAVYPCPPKAVDFTSGRTGELMILLVLVRFTWPTRVGKGDMVGPKCVPQGSG
jgi:hypothetical protein